MEKNETLQAQQSRATPSSVLRRSALLGARDYRTILLSTAVCLSLGACTGGGVNSTLAPPTMGISEQPIATPPLSPPSPAPSPGPAPTPAPAPPPSPTPAPVPEPSPPSPTLPPSGATESVAIAQERDVARRSIQDDAEYRTNYLASEYVNALYALDNGWDGSGVLVGVLDEGVEETLELQGQISSLSKDFGGIRENGTLSARSDLGGTNSEHGTLVSSIIAARNDGTGTQGFAPGAKIVVLRSDVEDRDSGRTLVGVNEHEAILYAGQNGVQIVNRSLTKANPEIANRLMQDAVMEYREMGGLVVTSAGNSGGPNPNDAIDMTDENREGWLFVVALEPTGTSYELASYSNRCGTALDRCVAGVGTSVTTDAAGRIVRFSGTSAAAPQVSSLAALILHKWPQLTGVDAGNIILSTARDIGEAGVDSLFGHGLIDVQSALSPIEPTLSNGSVSSPVGTSTMLVSNVIDNGGSTLSGVSTAISSVTVLDAFGRDYQADLSGLVRLADTQRNPGLSERLHLMANTASGVLELPTAAVSLRYAAADRMLPGEAAGGQFVSAKLTLRPNNPAYSLTMSYISEAESHTEADELFPSSDVLRAYMPGNTVGLALAHVRAGQQLGLEVRSSLGDGVRGSSIMAWAGMDNAQIKIGMVDEQNGLFGSPSGTGPLRLGNGALTVFSEVSSRSKLGSWSLAGYGGIGVTRLKIGRDLLLTHAEPIVSARFGLTLDRELAGGRFQLGLHQPLVSLSGAGSITIASGYNATRRSLEFSSREIDLTGEISPRLALSFSKSAARSRFRFMLGSALDGGSLRALGSWSMRFP